MPACPRTLASSSMRSMFFWFIAVRHSESRSTKNGGQSCSRQNLKSAVVTLMFPGVTCFLSDRSTKDDLMKCITFDVRGRRSGEAAKGTQKRSLWAVPLDGIVRARVENRMCFHEFGCRHHQWSCTLTRDCVRLDLQEIRKVS